MKTAIRLSTAAVCMTVCQATWAEPPGGSIRFQGIVMEGTFDGERTSPAMALDNAPHRATERTLADAAPKGAELLDYFVDTRRQAGIDAGNLHLITRTYF